MAQQPNLLQGPEPVETAELHFKISCKLKIFESESKYEGGHCCVLAASQYYGLIFAGNLNGFSVIKSKSLSPNADPEKFPRKNVVLNLRPTHISVDFSQKFLAVVCNSKPGSLLVFYDIQSFKQASKDITAVKVIPLSKLIQNLAAEVVDLTWQPVADGSLMICMSDGSVLALSQGAKDGPIFTLPNATQATCFCWSPKGKQIVIGTASGTLSQYKPDLKLVKTLPPPPLFNASMVVSVLWISSFQFAVAYNDRANPESFPVITIVNAAKNEPVNVINYEDITYSSTLFRNHQIYMTHHAAWNLIFVSSANSIEIAVLHSKDGFSWEQWLLGDASRAELPLNPDRLETFPLGWAFDFTSQEAIPWGEGSLPPMPRLLLMSDEGILCVFNVVNVDGNAPQLCTPPKENFEDSLFISLEKAATPPMSEPPKPAQSQKSILGTPPNANSKPTFTFNASPTLGGFGTAKPQTTAPQVAPIAFQQEQEPQQPQPQTQPQVQPPQQPLVSSTQPPATSTIFKLSGPQFGNTSPFSFGTNSVSLTVKPAITSTVTKTATNTQPTTPQPAPAKPPGDIFAGKTPPQSTPIKKPETPVITTTQTTKKQEEVVEPPGKTEEQPSQSETPGAVTPELAPVDDSVYLSALEEEIEHFNSELQQLTSKVSNLNITVGTEEDKAKMKKSIDGLYDFWKELKETTKGQSAEIHTVVMDLMEAFAWLEDAKSRNLQRKNPSYIELKKSEELNPLSARHMSEIGTLKYYIENQLKQLTSYLEKEWMDHQENYRNEVKGRMAVPPLEEVYKTMHFQLKILHKQKTLLEELKEKLATKKRKNKPQNFLISDSVPSQNKENKVSELSKLAENLLQLKINKEENYPRSGTWEMMKSQLNAISERSKKLTREKQSALRDALSECDMVKIRPVKTTLESSTFLRSLALEKVAQKAAQLKPQTPTPKAKVKETPAPTVQTKIVETPKPKPEAKPSQMMEKGKSEEKATIVKKTEAEKNLPVEKSQIPITVQAITETEEKSPLASLSGIVSNIGKKNETKPQQTFVFGSLSFQKAEPGKDNVVFGAGKLEQKQEKPKTTQTFTFGSSKPGETTFGSKEPIVFGAKSTFGATTLTPVTTKSDLPKTTAAPNVTITPVTTAPTTTVAFTFGAATTTAGLPKMNLLFTGKEQTPVFGTSGTAGNLFSAPTTTTQTSVFSSGLPLFGSTKTTTTFTTASTVPLFGSSPRFSFSQPVENKTVTTTTTSTATPPVSNIIATTVKPTSETEKVDVVKVDEPVKKPETPEKAKESPKVTVATSIFATAVTAAKTVPEVTTAPSTFSFVTTSQSSDSSSATVKSVAVTATATATASTESPATTSVIVSSVATAATTASTFSFSVSKAATPIAFGQTATATATASATMAGIFGTPTTTASVFGQVSSTTPTNIFGGAVTATPTTKIFGGATPTTTSAPTFGDSTPTKSIFGQAATPATPTTTTESLFGVSTPTTSTFGQATTPSTPTTFGQKSEVSQATNLFGQLLSDSNRSVFGTTTTTSTPTTNIFSTPKNLFGGGGSSTTASTASLFGTTSSSVFPQTTSVFGQTTTSASVFGQSQTSPSNTFFGQNICSPFGGGTSVTSNQSTFDSGAFSKPIFGQSLFGQTTTNNTSIFGGSSSSSLFGGTSSTTASNVFQTGTTSTTFGSSPGPFSGGTSSFGENSFGSPGNSFQKPLGGFGSPPVFGGGPAFGGSPTFGGSPSFGSMPTFGSLSQNTFGQSSSGSTTFENLANQNTVGFGNLAQQSQQNQSFRGGGFGSPSFENKPFGGTSFNCWRSK